MTYLTQFVGLVKHLEGCSPPDIAVQWDFHTLGNSTAALGGMEVLDSLAGCLDLKEKVSNRMILVETPLTLIARVRIAAITSREPPRTRLPGKEGSYSQIAVAFSTTAIFVMFFITSTFPRFTTCAKQLVEGLKMHQEE
jgi:hypothetical protein